jgi:hypothetical protein
MRPGLEPYRTAPLSYSLCAFCLADNAFGASIARRSSARLIFVGVVVGIDGFGLPQLFERERARGCRMELALAVGIDGLYVRGVFLAVDL